MRHRPIRQKLRIGLGLFAASSVVLFCSALHGLYNYRGLVKTLSARSTELPLASRLNEQIAQVRIVLGKARERQVVLNPDSVRYTGTDVAASSGADSYEFKVLKVQFRNEYELFQKALAAYRSRLDRNRRLYSQYIGDDEHEWATLAEIDQLVARIKQEKLADNLWLDELGGDLDRLEGAIDELTQLGAQLPNHLYERLHDISGEVKSQYRVALGLTYVTFFVAVALVLAAWRLLRKMIERPFLELVTGSKRVAAGDFSHRIAIDSRDEMGQLANAMNAMTARFLEIRDDLDAQVRQRTREVVRSEQLASVGFLAAGVAHEINNPLAAIAMSSESLESRLAELFTHVPADGQDEAEVVRSYLDMIQREAFRCKQITEKLLDFSRMGDSTKQTTDLRDLADGVIEMVRHLGKYQRKEVRLKPGEPVFALVSPQEMKQVLLNLITNGLDSLPADGVVEVAVERAGDWARITVTDNGCGMTEEVLKHLYEPFFTRGKGGQGTGLGLSITYRIVQEHQGRIDASSPGPGQGSKFIVTLPIEASKESAPSTIHFTRVASLQKSA